MGFLDLLTLAVVCTLAFAFWEKIRPKRICIVEDNPHDRLLFKINVHVDNCVFEYFDSSEGIIKEFWKRRRPDVVIIDYYLAGKTRGDKLLEFCENNGIQALLVTGNEGDILGVDKSKVLKKSADKKYYSTLENFIREAIA